MQATAAAREVPPAGKRRRDRDFQLLLTGSSVSMLGSRLTSIGYPLLVLALTGSPLVAGLVGFAATAPSILVYLPAGALVDRWDPWRAMLLCEFGRGAAVAIVVITVALGSPSVTQLTAVAVIEEILEVFSALAERRIVRSLVEPGNAAHDLARMEARTHMVVLFGRPLGGFLFGLSPGLPFLADSLSFGVSVAVLARIGRRRPCRPSEALAKLRLRREIGEGLRWIRSDPFARVAMPLTACTTFIGQALIMIFLAEAHFRHLPPSGIGIVLAASGAGGALGCAVADRLFRRFSYSLLQIQMWMWTGAFAMLALSGGSSFLLIAIALTIIGFSGALGNIALDTYLVRNVAERILGRITSADRLTTFGAFALGPLLGGACAEWCGIQQSILGLLVAVGLLTVVSGAAGSKPRRPDLLAPRP
jgi:predicted MFS family arabinose efflux permease